MPDSMRFLSCISFLFCTILFSAGAVQADDEAFKRLTEQLDGLQSFTADFSQRLINTDSVTVDPSLGRMVFKRPGQFRWIYETPYEQEIISDGKTLWVYDIDLDQVTIRPASDGLDRSPITILDEPDEIPKLYTVEILEERSNEIDIKLVPTYEGAAFKYVILIFSARKLVAMEIFDNFDQFNSLSFHNVEMNTEIDIAQFNFVPPKGVDVIDATKQSN